MNDKKIYLVTIYGDGYDEFYDGWTKVIGVCESSEIADKLKDKVETFMTPPISYDEWSKLNDKLDEQNEISSVDPVYALNKLFPEYSIDNLYRAKLCYEDYPNYVGCTIDEINYFENSMDLSKWKLI